jgi:hypothetical protein
MRRAVGVFLILLFGVGPLAEALPVNAESRLPACCRRHGAHHCAMAAQMAAAQALPASAPVFAPPAHCPSYPGAMAATTAAIDALTTALHGLSALLAQTHSPVAYRPVPRQSQARARTSRGPPAFSIA